jgi:molecular chaperone GrpE
MTTKKPTDKKKEPTSKKPVNLKEEVDKLKKDIKEKDQQLLRSIADFQNYQKRMEKELILKEEETKKKYISELIDLNELLKKALEDNNPKEGLKVMINNIENFFEKENIKYINCVGKKFDHNFHHALTTVEKDDCEDDTIIEEVKKGYMLNDKLLRPSQVIVSKKKDK